MPALYSVSRSSVFVTLVVGLTSSGCAFLKSLTGDNMVNLTDADVKSVGVDIRKEQKTICPREKVQMAVFVEAILKGEKKIRSFETWVGDGINRNDRLDFGDFAFHSEMGSFDESGWFLPNRDMVASAGKEFVLKTVYKKRPDQFSMETKYKPNYDCIQQVGKSGSSGIPGSSGSSGKDGTSGQSGGSTRSGSEGGEGGDGGDGSDGGDGGDGPRIKAFATLVKTPFYDKLVAVRITGDLEDLVLVPIDHPLVLRADGGNGGPGGSGGSGGRGGSGGSGSPTGGKGGKGGRGGNGGRGGHGGKGGEIELIFDERYPELQSQIKLAAAGGSGGDAGGKGSPGSGGSAGAGLGTNGKMGSIGSEGSSGKDGTSGPPGPDGHASAQPGFVEDSFKNLGEIQLLNQNIPTPVPAPAPPPNPKEKPVQKGKGTK